MPVLQPLAKLSGPRQVLLGATALLLAASGLPWYHLEGRGFTIELTGWHEIGVLAWGMAIVLLAWEIARMTRAVAVSGDEGDRVSAAGGLAVAFVGLLFVLRRFIDGDLGYGWMVGAVLLAALAASSVLLFENARGLQTLSARFGEGEAPEESRPHDPDAPRPGAAPTPEWRRPQQGVALTSAASSLAASPLAASPLAASPPAASPVPAWRATDAEWSPGARPAWRTAEEEAAAAPPSGAPLPWRAAGPQGGAGSDARPFPGVGARSAPGAGAHPASGAGAGPESVADIRPSRIPGATNMAVSAAATPDAPVVPAADAPIVPAGPGPSVAPDPAPRGPGRARGWVPPWRRERGDDGDLGDGRRGSRDDGRPADGRGRRDGRRGSRDDGRPADGRGRRDGGRGASTAAGPSATPERRSGPRRTEDVPPWRESGSVQPPPGGWPKSIAEKQRDEPPLWG